MKSSSKGYYSGRYSLILAIILFIIPTWAMAGFFSVTFKNIKLAIYNCDVKKAEDTLWKCTFNILTLEGTCYPDSKDKDMEGCFVGLKFEMD
jgi:hypothetical protein